MYKNIIKPLADFIAALFLLVLLFPIILLTALLLLITNKGKVFFFQKRPGLNNKLFKIIKFKTMKDAFDENGLPLPDFIRMTKVGSFVRSTSLDELLQLINVLKGDMSIVGPRPLLIQYLSRYNSEQIKRHNVKPGITGWAQVNGRNAINWEDKFNYDIEYVYKQSFFLDFSILCKTIISVIKRKGISSNNNATMEEFI
mgnify:CR=1 FL=1